GGWVPGVWALDRVGRRAWVGDPIAHQAELLPLVRLGSLWIWVVGLGLTAAWARLLSGPQAMALAAWLFALSPNLLAHGALVTMEIPLLTCTTALLFLFCQFLQTGIQRYFWAAAAVGGLAFSCKYTTVLLPPIIGLLWWIDRWRGGERHGLRLTLGVVGSMFGFVLFLLAFDVLVTGGATLPLSQGSGSHPSLDSRLGPWLGGVVTRAVEAPIPQ